MSQVDYLRTCTQPQKLPEWRAEMGRTSCNERQTALLDFQIVFTLDKFEVVYHVKGQMGTESHR